MIPQTSAISASLESPNWENPNDTDRDGWSKQYTMTPSSLSYSPDPEIPPNLKSLGGKPKTFTEKHRSGSYFWTCVFPIFYMRGVTCGTGNLQRTRCPWMRTIYTVDCISLLTGVLQLVPWYFPHISYFLSYSRCVSRQGLGSSLEEHIFKGEEEKKG